MFLFCRLIYLFYLCNKKFECEFCYLRFREVLFRERKTQQKNLTEQCWSMMAGCGLRAILRTADYRVGIQFKSCLQEFSQQTQCPLFLCLYFFSILPKINTTELLHKQKKLKSTLTRLQYAQKVLILQKIFHYDI